jgi:hypothetical protein
MYKLAANQVSADDVADEFTIVFRDPEKFIGWLYETRDTEKKLIAWFRPHGRELVEKIASLRPTFASIKEHINDPAFRNEMDRFLRSKTLEIRNNWIIQMFENDPDLRSKAPDEKALTDLPLGALPSLDTSVAVLGEHIGNQRWVKS